ncbi:wd40 protein [Dorcoceras hygrometricum]|uniref:Wd40 protein n=1 Tax=Dorcoceras hygrometricum TaxID=472368 RepID=A0A2Z7AET1_9LAMI|nr:wd40 protein [Dorcoceras hygrometricum]
MITGGKSFVSSPPAFSNDAKRLLVCTGKTVSIFSTSTGLQTSELVGHSSLVTSVIVVPASTPGSTVLCFCWTSSSDGTIKYWDFAAPELMRTIDIRFPVHSMVIPSLFSQRTRSDKNLSDLFAYVYTEDVKQKGELQSFSCGQIRKCNLTKSRLVGGVTLAETTKPGSMTISPSGKYIGIYERRKLRIWEIPGDDSENVAYKKVRLHHTKSLTTLAFHPTERIAAAGDATGRILLWRGVGNGAFSNGGKLINRGTNGDVEDRPGVRGDDDADSCTTWHWHSSEVNVLFFSSDGAYLYSGGKEGVLVAWQLDTGKKKFLPRIGSQLLHFINSSDPSLACISCADNRIHLLRMPLMEILRSISGIKLPGSFSEMSDGFGLGTVINYTAGLIAVPTENCRVQFYSLFDDREISEVQICQRNHHPGDIITVKVNLVALSSDCSTMITVEIRLPEEGIGSLVSLKFWSWHSQNKTFSLSTIVYEPHREAEISSIAFRSTSSMAVSSSYGGDFKANFTFQFIYCIVTRIASLSLKDSLPKVPFGRTKPMTAAAFSSDGTVLAVAADKVITLWDPDTNILVSVIGDSLQPITTLLFVGKSKYLVSASQGSNPQVTIWNMATLTTCWSYWLHAEALTCSMNNSSFAVLARSMSPISMQSDHTASPSADGVILFFDVENPVPLSAWFVSKVLGFSPYRWETVLLTAAKTNAFCIGRSMAEGGELSFVQSSPKLNENSEESKTAEVLAYINSAHEYVLFNPYDAQSDKLSISGPRNFGNPEETESFGYASIYGELPVFSLAMDQTPLPSIQSEKTWKTIFSGPSHSLPPLPKLCSEFLESLLERRPTVVE